MNKKIQHSTSGIGMFLSIACAIHCMMMPVIIMAFPVFSDSFLHNPVLEWSILVVLVVLGIVSLNHYRKEHHNNNLPILVFVFGAVLFFTSLAFTPQFHHTLTIAGSLIIAVSHGINLSLKKVIAQ